MSTTRQDIHACPNFVLCEGRAWNKSTETRSMCVTCKIFGWQPLLTAPQRDACPVCFEETGTAIQFPACTHFFCVPCTQKILFWDERFFHLSAEAYGCPPCPNGCQNPTRGRQCDCHAYEEVLEAWGACDALAWQRWNDDEQDAIDRGLMQKGVLASRRCPLCRAMC